MLVTDERTNLLCRRKNDGLGSYSLISCIAGHYAFSLLCATFGKIFQKCFVLRNSVRLFTLIQCILVLFMSLCLQLPAYCHQWPHSLQYFGYFASSATNDDCGRPVDNTAILSKHVNLVWLSERDALRRFAEVRAANKNGARLRVVFIPYWTLFVKGMQLHPEYTHRWQALTKILDENIDLITAFYPVDEPYLRAAKFTQPRMEQREAYSVLSSVVDLIKSTYKNKAIWTFFSCRQLYPDVSIPDTIDSIGVTCYGQDKFYGETLTKRLEKYYGIIDANVDNDTSFLVIPEAFYSTRNEKIEGVSREHQEYLISRLSKYFSFAMKHDRVVGFIPFLWQDYTTQQGKRVFGVESMELVRAYLNGISEAIISPE